MAAKGEWTEKESRLTITLPIYADDIEALTEEAERCRLAALTARTTFPPDYSSRAEASFMDPWSYEPPDRGGDREERKTERALEVRESIAKAREGKPLTFPTRKARPR